MGRIKAFMSKVWLMHTVHIRFEHHYCNKDKQVVRQTKTLGSRVNALALIACPQITRANHLRR